MGVPPMSQPSGLALFVHRPSRSGPGPSELGSFGTFVGLPPGRPRSMGVPPMSQAIELALFVHRHFPLRSRTVRIGFVWHIRRARHRAVFRSMGVPPMSQPTELALFVHQALPLRPQTVRIGFVWHICRARHRAVSRSMGATAHVPARRSRNWVCLYNSLVPVSQGPVPHATATRLALFAQHFFNRLPTTDYRLPPPGFGLNSAGRHRPTLASLAMLVQ